MKKADQRDFKLEIFADYFQFYLQDDGAEGDFGEMWNAVAAKRMLAVAQGTLGIGTLRNMSVPVTIRLLNRPCKLDLEKWDHIAEGGILISSGRLVIAGCTEYYPDAKRIQVTAGYYRARIHVSGASTILRNGLEGDDHYLIELWPDRRRKLTVLKQLIAGPLVNI